MKKTILLLIAPAVALMIPSLVSAKDSSSGQTPPSPSQVSCMAELGFSKPATKPASPPTLEQREKMKAAASACGITKKSGSFHASKVKPNSGPGAALTSAQITCMAELGFSKPATKPATPPTLEQREKMKAAASACGITKKSGSFHASKAKPNSGPGAALTSAQITCMAELGFSKPATKPATPPTLEQREKMKAAASACGITKKSGSFHASKVKPNSNPGAALTSAQITCMAELGFSKPATKPATPPTLEQREKMKAAASACGLAKPLKKR